MSRVGYHVKKTEAPAGVSFPDHIAATYAAIQELGFDPCIQIYVTNPRGGDTTLSDEDTRVLAQWPHRECIVVHGSYTNVPWSLKPYSLKLLAKELAIAHAIGSRGVIVHLYENAYETIGDVLAYLSAQRVQTRLWLENKPSRRGGVGNTPAQMHALVAAIMTAMSALKDAGKLRPRIGFCLDTQHAFAAGVDLTYYDESYEWITAMRAAIPSKFPMMIHLNDSSAELGTGADKHADVFRGLMWSRFGLGVRKRDPVESGLFAIAIFADENGMDVILETHDRDGDMRTLRDVGLGKK